MVEEAEVSSEVWVSEGSRSPASQMIEKLRDKSGYLLETKAVSMTSEQENNSQELEMVDPLILFQKCTLRIFGVLCGL